MNILSFDIESCTGSPYDGSMCSFGYYLTDENFKKIKQKDILINPLPKKFKLNTSNGKRIINLAYTEETFRKAPRFKVVYDNIKQLFCADNIVVGFALDNDLRFINNICKIYKLDTIYFKYLDVHFIYELFNPTNKKNSLSTLVGDLGISYVEHRSDEDARVTMLLLKSICKKMGLSLLELVDKYGIQYGENFGDNYTRNYSLSQFKRQNGLNLTLSQKNLLLKDFKSKVYTKKVTGENILKSKYIKLSHYIELEDIDLSRRIIKRIKNLGGKCVNDASYSNLYVYDERHRIEKDEKTISLLNEVTENIQMIELKEFIKLISPLPKLKFRDVEILVKHYKEKVEIV